MNEAELKKRAEAKGWYIRASASVPDLTTGGYRHPFSITLSSTDLLDLIAEGKMQTYQNVKDQYPSIRGFQASVKDAHVPIFHDDPTSIYERTCRFFEEATELFQAMGVSEVDAHALVTRQFSRPRGDQMQEVGGVAVTLASLCVVAGIDLQDAATADLVKLQTPEQIARIRAKRATRDRNSPLPGRDSLIQIDTNRSGKEPCGECHIQEGETCDICGATSPLVHPKPRPKSPYDPDSKFRCSECGVTYSRDQCYIRKGSLECPKCLSSYQICGTLVHIEEDAKRD